MTTPALFTPIKLRELAIRNRVVLSPMCQYLAVDGCVTDWHYAHHAKFAMAGVGVGMVEATAVTREGRITHGCTGLWDDAQIDGMARIAELYSRYGAVPAIQLNHAGWKGSAQRPLEGAGPLSTETREAPWQTLGPSAISCKQGWPAAQAMSTADIEALKEAWRQAFRRALRAGFRIVEVHAAHGYLVHSFLSPISNKRADAYGGDLRGRMRLALEIADIAREEWPADLPVFFRISSIDDAQGGWTLEDSVVLAAELKQRGVDAIDCSAGGLQNLPISGRTLPPQGFQVPYAARIRKETGIATMAVGLILDAEFADAVIRKGDADLIAIGREFLADPNWVFHAAQRLGFDGALDLLPREYSFYLARRTASRKTA